MHYQKWSNTTMRGILNLAGQCFAVLAVTIGLSSYGCMDVTSVNPVVELASLTVTPGTLQPAFTGGTTQYTVDLTRDVTSVRITAQPAVAGDKVTINGQAMTSSTIALGAEGSTTSVSIVVSESSNNSRTYIVLLKRASLAGNNSLLTLAVSPGTLAPAFNANTLGYSVDVANNVDSVTVTPTLSDPAATMSISVNNGQPTNINSGQTQTIPLGGTGSSTPIDIVVTAQNSSQKTYRVTFNRGKSGNNLLQGLAISPGTLNPSFGPDTEGYTVNLASILPGNPTSMTVTPTLQDLTTSMSISVNNGPPTNINSGETRSIPLPAPNSTTFIAIVVTAQNGTLKTYSVNVIRAALNGNNSLQSLTVSPGTLAPAFNANTLIYSVDVANNVDSVTVTPTLQASAATMTVNGQVTNSGEESQPIQLGGMGSSTPIDIVVTAQNNNTKTYTLTVHRAAPSNNNNLSALTVTANNVGQPLDPGFNASTLGYTVNVASTVDQVTVAATKSDVNAVMLIGSVTVPAGTASGAAPNIPLDGPGTQTAVSISVTAQSGGAPKIYTITVKRAASSDDTLSALTVTPPGTLPPPGFVSSTLTYTVDVATDVTSVDVSATKSDPNAVMLIGSVTVPAGTVSGQETFPLNGAGGSPTILSIDVTAQSGGAPKTYTITVNRAAAPPPP